MSAFFLMALLLGAPEIDIHLAPDQPVPLVYPDDPLIVEFEASEAVTAKVQVQIQGKAQQPTVVDLGQIDLRADTPHWRAVGEAPTDRDYYRATFTLDIAGTTTQLVRGFCRVNRPRTPKAFPIGANLVSIDRLSLLALKGIPLRFVRFNATAPDIEAHVREAFALGMEVGVTLALEEMEEPEKLAESLSKMLPDTVVSWHLELGRDIELFEPVAQALRRGGSRAPIVLVASGPQEVVALLDAGGGSVASAIELQGDAPGQLELSLIQEAAENAGYEAVPIYAVGRGVADEADEPGVRLSRQVLLNCAAGIARTHLDMGLIYDAGRMGEGYVYLSALAQLLDCAVHVGELDTPSPCHAPVFRQGNRWVLALWTMGEAVDLALPLGGATDLSLVDGRGNPLPLVAAPEGEIAIPVGAEPCYLAGQGGDLMLRSALRMAHAEAKALADNELFAEQLPEEIVDVFKAVADETAPPEEEVPAQEIKKPGRPSFFALLRAFPYLEQQWHLGDLPHDTAVPAMAALTRLVRVLCVVEQESSEEFIEPLSNTLAECREYQTRYLMNSTGDTTSLERGEWLLDEVSRLAAEAEQLQAQGRQIEARGLATLAEWRARSLEFAAQAKPVERPTRLKELQVEETDEESEEEPGILKLKKRVEE